VVVGRTIVGILTVAKVGGFIHIDPDAVKVDIVIELLKSFTPPGGSSWV